MRKLLFSLISLLVLCSGCIEFDRLSPHIPPPILNCDDPTLAKSSREGDVRDQPVFYDNRGRTVADVLKTIGAHCQDGKLLDGNGREIYLYCHMGSPIRKSQEQIDRSQKEEEKHLKELREKYTLIIYSCKTKLE